MPGVLVAILAAGGGTRFDGPTHKLLAPFRGDTVIGQAVQAAVEADVGPVLVVSGAVRLELDVEVLCNERWADGQAGSLQVAIAHAAGLEMDSLLIGLGDQPLVTPDAWRSVASSSGGPIVTATYNGLARPPVRLDREVWPLLPRDGDEGARALMRRHPELVTEVAVPGEPADIDTVEELLRWS